MFCGESVEFGAATVVVEVSAIRGTFKDSSVSPIVKSFSALRKREH